jgi:hypothetical protein
MQTVVIEKKDRKAQKYRSELKNVKQKQRVFMQHIQNVYYVVVSIPGGGGGGPDGDRGVFNK